MFTLVQPPLSLDMYPMRHWLQVQPSENLEQPFTAHCKDVCMQAAALGVEWEVGVASLIDSERQVPAP